MKWHRIWAVTLRHMRQFVRDFNNLSSIFIFPLINLLVFGYMGIWMAGAASNPLIKLQLLSGITVLQLINRSCVSLGLSFFEELKSHNLTNLFSAPITIHEWLIASGIKALITCGLLFTFLTLSIWLVFSINILAAGPTLMLIILLAFISSMSLGLLAISILLMCGINAHEIIWILAAFVMILSGALYPIAVMPSFLQTCATYLPFMDLFSVLRVLTTTNTIAWQLVARSICLNSCYLVASYLLVLYVFKISKKRGLERLMD